MTGYTKLFGSIVASTIWREDNETRIVWITMLALANKHGVVEASIPGLADLARVSVEACEAAIEKLKAPDRYSRTKEHDGRRIQDADGGWVVLNHSKYRAKMSNDERRDYFAEKQREFRAKRAVNKTFDMSIVSTQAEAEAQSEAEEDVQSSKKIVRMPRPSIEEVKAYGLAISLPETEAVRCFNYYESNGWRVGRNPMKDWRAALRNWKIKWETDRRPAAPVKTLTQKMLDEDGKEADRFLKDLKSKGLV